MDLRAQLYDAGALIAEVPLPTDAVRHLRTVERNNRTVTEPCDPGLPGASAVGPDVLLCGDRAFARRPYQPPPSTGVQWYDAASVHALDQGAIAGGRA